MRAGILVVLALSLPLFADPPDGASFQITVTEVKGDVDVQADAKSDWKPAKQGDVVPVGAKICTGIDSAAVLAFGSNSVAMVREASWVEIVSFGMKGDELVAQVMVNPGVCSVAVKQLEKFKTDFEVSTPRLTASVRGSGVTTHANGGPTDLEDTARVDDDFATMVFPNGQERGIAQGGGTNSNNVSPTDSALAANTAGTSLLGMTNAETANADLASTTAQSTDILASNLNGFGADPTQDTAQQQPPAESAPVSMLFQLVLTWGALPLDLDFYLQVPLATGGRDEVSTSHMTSNDGATNLDLDKVAGFGPETMTVFPSVAGGHYTAYVKQFGSGGGPQGNFAGSQAQVVFDPNDGSPTVAIQATGVGDATPGPGDHWIVGQVNVDAQGKATFTTIDTYSPNPPPNN